MLNSIFGVNIGSRSEAANFKGVFLSARAEYFSPLEPSFFAEKTSFRINVNMICEGFFKSLCLIYSPLKMGLIWVRGATPRVLLKKKLFLF